MYSHINLLDTSVGVLTLCIYMGVCSCYWNNVEVVGKQVETTGQKQR